MTINSLLPQNQTEGKSPQAGPQILDKIDLTLFGGVDGTTDAALLKADALPPVYLDNGSQGASFTWDTGVAKTQRIVVTENITITLNNADTDDGEEANLIIFQDATGGHTITFAGNIGFTGGSQPTLTTTANAVALIRGVGHSGNQFGAFVAADNLSDFV